MEYDGTNLSEFMEAATSEDDWTRRWEVVKGHHGDYPENWYGEILASGLYTRVVESFGCRDGIQVTSFQKRMGLGR